MEKKGGKIVEEIKELYDLYHDDLYRYIFSLTKNQHQTEDILQSTFLSALQSLSSFQRRSTIKTWLIGIARHEYFSYLRKNPMELGIYELTVEPGDIDPSEHELSWIILQELSKLSELQKKIAVLRLFNELTFAEISIIIGKTENYCRVSFFRTKQKLMEVLQNEAD